METKVAHRVHKGTTLTSIISHMNIVHTLAPYFHVILNINVLDVLKYCLLTLRYDKLSKFGVDVKLCIKLINSFYTGRSTSQANRGELVKNILLSPGGV